MATYNSLTRRDNILFNKLEQSWVWDEIKSYNFYCQNNQS